MEHLDLAGIMTTPPQWNTPVFDQQDAIYLSSSRQMLEPIMEETSEDEEYAWNQYDSQLSDSGGGGGGREDCDDGEEGGEDLHESLCSAGNCGRNTSSFYSSAESDTGSVIRVEINKDNDSNSERDILCPAKRARRCEDPTSEDEVVLRRPHLMTYGEMKNNSLERFLNYENVARDSWGSGAQQLSQPQRNSLGNRRPPGGNGFDDFYSDSDSLSYNSLSRSSSLIQFESLERQLMLQEQHASMNSLGNSSPSLLSFDMSTTNSEDPSRNSLNSSNNSANNSRRGSQSSLLKKYESLDGRLHQTYYDLDKLNFDDMETGNGGENFVRSGLKLAELRSDSESSGSSSSSEASDGGSSRCPSVLSPRDLMEGEFSKKFQRSQSRKGKSSAENLSEDSGYCEPFGGGGLLRRSKSQSLCKNYEKFSEEDEELMEHKSLQQERAERKAGEAEAEDEAEAEKAKHSIEEFKNNTSLYQTPPTSPLLDYMRQQQRSLAHSPSPVSSEVSTVSSASSKNSATSSSSSLGANSCSSSSSSSTTSSATTCASRASFTWLMPALRTTTPPPPPPPAPSARASDCPENTLRISFDDLGERKTSNGKDQLNDGVVESGKTTTTTTRTTSAVTTKTTTTTICGDKENEHPKEGGSLARTQTPSDDVKELKIENFELEKRQNCGVLETNFDFENNFEKIEQLSEEFPTKSVKKQLSCEKNFENFPRILSSPPPKIEDEFLLRKLQEQEKYLELNSGGFEEPENHTKSSEENWENSENQRLRKILENSNSSLPEKYLENSKSSEKNLEKILKSENYSNLHSQTCEKLKTPPPCYTSESDYSPAADRRSFPNLMQNWPERTASVPTELNKLGRRKKLKKIRQKFPPSQRDSNSTESEEAEGGEETATNLKRSSSWCFESSPPAQDQEKQPLARLHRSYYNLTQLDLGAEKMAEKRISSASGGDYETELVCKNNFLLDELSAHYDRTASILNDRPMSGEREVEIPSKLSDVVDCGPAPKPPARRRKSSNSSHSETEIEDPSEVQHVQLVIRKPPARQKRQPAHNEEKAHSLTQDFSFASLMQTGKTFDQDPTMLKTSYAQSLEKCNFDCREISNPDLSRSRTMPKRRFHSQANASKKKNLVSSTPNLNAYQKEGEGDQEFEDDLFVCSATNSMHQLNVNQAPKPLGILLPAGSRSSFGKEVSFCPVVSKYSWQEQSSEECHDEAEAEGELPASEESDDELLDNCDAVVLKNTKENEIIGSFYKECEEKSGKEQTTQEKTMQEKYKAVIKELPTLINKTGEDQKEMSNEEHKRNNGGRERHTDSELTTHTTQANVNNSMEEHKRNHTHSGEVGALRQTKQQSKDEQMQSSCEEQKRIELNSLPPQQPLAVAVVKTKQETSHLRPSGEHMADGTQHENNGMEQGDNSVVITTATFSLTTNVNNETLSANKTDIKPELQNEKVQDAAETDSQAKTNQINCETKTIKPTIVIARPISIQLPILSEPPTNRAHHILYASQQMLDKFQRQQENETRQYSNKSQSVQNLSSKMSSAAKSNNATISSSSSSTTKINNNNEIMKSKFKADEKHPNSKGFLSRFANGFRFSMRKNKKSKLNKEEQQQQPQMEIKKSNAAPVKSSNKITSSSSSKSAQPDYIYIPLKGPLPEKYETGFFESHQQQKEQTNGNPTTTNGNAVTTNGSNGKLATVAKKGTKTSSKSEKVTGKPPLPPQQQQQQQQQATQKSQSANSNTPAVMGSSRFYTQELQQTADTATTPPFAAAMAPLNPRGSTEDFLNAERGALSRQRHQSFGNNEQQHNMNYHDLDGSSPSRATVSQKTEMFNNLSRNAASGAAEPKIGLIETNLDTHETVITGKTRSLMNIGPNSSSSSGHNKRHTLGGGHHHVHGGGAGDDDDDDYDDNDEVVVRPDGTVVVIKNAGTTTTTSGGQAAQIASVRRPHKSMEFLLDKENQKDVMVSVKKTKQKINREKTKKEKKNNKRRETREEEE
uniref:Uncharacterized protein n=1 Tax=Musca domestica TaxID=7370 RepID=A0A1I8MY15_MUSDO